MTDFVNEFKNKYSSNFANYMINVNIQDQIFKKIFEDIYTEFCIKFKPFLPQNIYQEATLVLMLLLLTNYNRGDISEYRKVILINLLNTSALENNQDSVNFDKYDSGVFSEFIVTIIKLCQATLLNIFLGKILLSQNFDDEDINDLYYNKKSIKSISGKETLLYEDLNIYYIKKFKDLNKEVNETAVDELCLAYVFEPIKDLIKSHSDEVYVKISNKSISNVILNLEYLMDPYNLLEIFLTLKITDYI